MKRIELGPSVNCLKQQPTSSWRDLRLAAPWPEVINCLQPGPAPRRVQLAALRDYCLLESRRNLIVSAPTNSGKTLIGLLALLQAIRNGRRALLLEPLRAVAREKHDELQELAPQLARVLGRPITVRITTGDYRLDSETLSAPPPDTGELIIATPERLEVILRNPDFDAWAASVGAVCVDEAHLLSTPHRGPTLEYVLTSLLCLAVPPRLVLLSASVGDARRAQEWLAPCDVVHVAGREPPLRKAILELSLEDETNTVIDAVASNLLSDPEHSLLVFVYQTRSTDRLVARWRVAFPSANPLAYHAQMSTDRRQAARTAFRTGASRCLVTTTALGLGVNLPATHVLVRDTTFPGVGALTVGDLLQMMGRAGRGQRPGEAVVLLRPSDSWKASELADALQSEALPTLTSGLDAYVGHQGRRIDNDNTPLITANLVAAQLARRPETGFKLAELQGFFGRSLGAASIQPQLGSAVDWLIDPAQALAFQSNIGQIRLTRLGLEATRASLPLDLAAGVAQLVRDLLSIDPSDRYLANWRPLDTLLLLHLRRESFPKLRPFGQPLVEQVETWLEAHSSQAPVVYREWIRGSAETSRAVELCGSLGLASSRPDQAWQRAMQATFSAIVLWELGQGLGQAELERRFGVRNLEGLEERWHDETLWLLSGLAAILEIRSFYHHLREVCQADDERVLRVKAILRNLRRQVYDLQVDLQHCSPLGPMLRSLRRSRSSAAPGPTIGVRSIRRLEAAGVTSVAELARLDEEGLIRLGLRRSAAKQVCRYVRQRLQ